MPIMKCKGGWKFGKNGKCYKTKAQALKQMRAIKASQSRRKK
jgi:hypothetical protein